MHLLFGILKAKIKTVVEEIEIWRFLQMDPNFYMARYSFSPRRWDDSDNRPAPWIYLRVLFSRINLLSPQNSAVLQGKPACEGSDKGETMTSPAEIRGCPANSLIKLNFSCQRWDAKAAVYFCKLAIAKSRLFSLIFLDLLFVDSF